MPRIGEVIASFGKAIASITEAVGKLADFAVEAGKGIVRAGVAIAKGIHKFAVKTKNLFSRKVEKGRVETKRVAQKQQQRAASVESQGTLATESTKSTASKSKTVKSPKTQGHVHRPRDDEKKTDLLDKLPPFPIV